MQSTNQKISEMLLMLEFKIISLYFYILFHYNESSVSLKKLLKFILNLTSQDISFCFHFGLFLSFSFLTINV